MENMTDYQYAWMIYLVGALGCTLATWLLFRRFGRAAAHFFVITVGVVLFTPYAVDADAMIMAPAVYALVFGFMDGGFTLIKPVVKLMLGLWGGALILSLLYQLLTRHRYHAHLTERAARSRTARASSRRQYLDIDESDWDEATHSRRTNSTRALSRDERIARDELLREEPIRAIR